MSKKKAKRPAIRPTKKQLTKKKTAAAPRSGSRSSQVAATAAPPPRTPIHHWTNGGTRVLVLRCGEDGYGGFTWPTTVGATTVARDPNRDPVCGGGLHGWPWGLALGEGKPPDWAAKWIVFAADPADVILLDGGKVKCVGTVEVVHVGTWLTASNFILAGQMAWAHYASQIDTAASSSGDGAPASSSGYGAPASSSGVRAPARATGKAAAAVATGIESKAQAGEYGVIALALYNKTQKRYEMRCARIGCGDGSDGLLKAGVWYRLNAAGEFVETT